MKKITLFRIITLSILINLFIVSNSFALDYNECKAQKGDQKTFFTCLKNYTQNDQSSFGILETLFGKIDLKINISDNITFYQTYDDGTINKCIIKKENKEDFIKDLEKQSNGNFGTNQLSYATCTIEYKNYNKEELSKIDINDLEIIEETSSYKLLKGEDKGYLYTIAKNGMKINGKQIEDKLCEIIGSNGKGLRYINPYIVDNKYIYINKSFVDGNSGLINCKINKINVNIENIDLKSLEYLDGKYFKDKNGIYYLLEGYRDKKGEFLKLENVDIKTFKVIDDFYQKAEDKNNVYIKGKLDHKKRKLIKKDNITIDDFEIYNEKLSSNHQNMYNGILLDLSYEANIKTNVEGKFMWKISFNSDKIRFNSSNEFEEGKSFIYHNFYIDKGYTEILIDIYDKDKAKFSFQDGEKIGTIKRKIKFTENMDKPEFVQNEDTKNNFTDKVDILLNKIDNKLSNKSLQTKLDFYKKALLKANKLKEKYKNSKHEELVNYIHKKIRIKYFKTFKEYILEKNQNK